MRRALLVLMFTAGAWAQSLTDLVHFHADLPEFSSPAGQRPLRCEVTPAPPVLDFAFRFRAGYTFHIPSAQYQAPTHAWLVLTKITPRGGGEPAYLFARTSAASVGKTDGNFEVQGTYLLGMGRYLVESTIYDDSGRACQRNWQIKALRSRSQRAVELSLPPFTVRDLPGLRSSDWKPAAASRPVTVLFNAAPLSPRGTRLRPSDWNVMLSALASVVGRVPATSVSLVVFSLEAQKELFRSDRFSINALSEVIRAIDSLQLNTVDVRILQNPTGHIDLLTRLINQELNAAAPPAAVILMGPMSRFADKVPEGALAPAPAGTQVFYVQYQSGQRRLPPDDDAAEMPMRRIRPAPPAAGSQSGQTDSTASTPPPPATPPGPPPPNNDPTNPSVPPSGLGRGARNGSGNSAIPFPSSQQPGQHDKDVIDSAVARLKGRTVVIRTPADLAKAIGILQRLLK